MRGKSLRIVATGIVLAALGLSAIGAMAAEASRISKEDLKAMLGDPNLVILDVRVHKDWGKGERKITGAIRENPKKFNSWADNYSKDKTLVLYCA